MPPPPLPGLERRITALMRRAVHDQENAEVREVVRLRAHNACEYCLMTTETRFHVDHIIPPDLWDLYIIGRLASVPTRSGRNGPNHIDNYGWSCPLCNEAKGQQVVRHVGRTLACFFDPRYDHWPEHFSFFEGSDYLYVSGTSLEGRATELGLGLNKGDTDGPLGPRHVAIGEKRYPPRWARNAYSL